ncbi:Pentatricopeptide repeat (PPR) superfamily protein [Euphorbia peplus]|nr:Pentatricopeptide repeat (PPR) superfamily protein [Euphorbia peplus]
MDIQDHVKTQTSGVHICRQCGWPFPNPHPSSRHRRAHRKICGSVPGYKFLDSRSTLSDDSDDEDHKTPSPLVPQRSGGSGERTTRSADDDGFVDAVTEFSDSGSAKGVEDSSDDANKRTRSVEVTVEDRMKTVLSFEDDATTAVVPPSSNSPDSSQTTVIQEENLSADALESKSQASHVITGSVGRALTDCGTEKSGHQSVDEKQSSTCDLDPFQLDYRADASQENMKKRAREELAVADIMGNKDQNKKRNAVDDLIDVDTHEIETSHLDRLVVDFATTDNAIQTSEAVYTSGKTEDVTSDHVAAAGVIELKEQCGEELDMKKSLDAPSSEVDAIEHANTYFSTSPINVSATGEMASASSGKLTEIANEQGEVNDNFHVLSVPADIPVLKNPEIMIGGYKDHTAWRRPQLVDVDSFEVINSAKDSVHQVIPPNSLSSLSVEGEQLFASGSHTLQDDIQPEGGKSEPVKDSVHQVIATNSFSSLSDEGEQLFALDTQVSGDSTVEGRNRESIVEMFLDETELGESQVREAVNQGHVTNESCALKDAVAANEVEKSTVHSPQEQLPDDYNRNLSESNVLEHGTGSISDTTSVAAFVQAGIKQASNLVGTDDAADYEINGLDITKREEVKVISEDSSGQIMATPENLGIFSEGKVESFSLEEGMGSTSDTASVAALVDAEVRQASNTVGADDAADDEISEFDITKSEEEKGIAEDSSVNIMATTENLDILSEGKAHVRNDFSKDKNGNDKGENTNGSKTETREGDSSLVSVDGSTLMNTIMAAENDKDLDETLMISKAVVNTCEVNVSEPECLLLNKASDNQESVLEYETNDKAKVLGEDCQAGESDNVGDIGKLHKSVTNAGDVEILQTSSDKIDDFEVLQKSPKEHTTKESRLSPSNASVSIQSRATVGDNPARDSVDAAPEDQPGENKLVAQQLGASATDLSVDSGSQTDSLEGHWGSVSVISTQSDMQATIDTEPLTHGTKASAAEKSDLEMPKTSMEGAQQTGKSDIFEPPSFMTLVEPRDEDKAAAADDEIRTGQNVQQPKDAQAGWFPSLTNVVNESQGRKKNEEIIAKVTNWSTPKQHAPLKNLLSEANTENKSKLSNPKENQLEEVQKDEAQQTVISARDNSVSAATLKPTATPEMGIAEPFKKDETGKEWNSPARYPADIKREKRKEKGRPYWAQFMCCSSVN